MISRVEARLPGVVIVVLGVLFCAGALSYGVLDDGRMGPGLMPMVTGLGLVVLGTMIALTAGREAGAVTADGDVRRRDEVGGGDDTVVVAPTMDEPVEQQSADGVVAQEVQHPAHPWLILGTTVAGLLVTPLIGLIPALGLMSLVLLRFVESESWRLTVVVTVAEVVGAWFLFEEVLDVTMPWGVFGGFL